MGKIIKTTLVRRASQLPKLKSTGYSIILGRNLVNKQKEKKEKKMAKIIWKGVAKKDDPIYGGGFIISYQNVNHQLISIKLLLISRKIIKIKDLKMKKR